MCIRDSHYVDISSITNNEIDYSQMIKGTNAPSRARRLAQNGDVIISTVRPNLKGFAIARNIPEHTLFSTGFAILSSKDEKVLLNEFIYRMFMDDKTLMDQILIDMNKGSYPSINQANINNFDIVIPSIPEQVTILNEFNELDKKIADEQAIITEQSEKVKSKFVEMFGLEQFIEDETTSQYNLMPIESICDDGRGRVISKMCIRDSVYADDHT